ncbi:MAG: chitosanase [Alphaproteobacteria bacterium]|nr:chitosanase [Alphaproteobacteria bacterium]
MTKFRPIIPQRWKIAFVLTLFLVNYVPGPTQAASNQTQATNNQNTGNGLDLSDPAKKEIAMQFVSSAENSTLDWRAQYGYIEDIGDHRGYTGGIIGFTSATGDMIDVIEEYTKLAPKNTLTAFLPALRQVNGSASHKGLETEFVTAWKLAAHDPLFQTAQNNIRDRDYFYPALALAKIDGLGILGQLIYYDAAVVHGLGAEETTLNAIRATALKYAKAPAQGGNEGDYLKAFLDARDEVMESEEAHSDLSRDDAQRQFLRQGKLQLELPLKWTMYNDVYYIPK